MDPLNQIIFDDKSFSDLLKEIHKNQSKKSKQLASLIAELRPLITNLGDATVVVPLIKEYMEIGVKNDEALIKMATIIQRVLQNKNEDEGLGITDEEKSQLLEEMEKLQKNKDK